MQHISLTTRIAAPIERCFLLSLSIDLHQQAASHTMERAIAGVTHGIIGAGETVTWQGRHFGLMLTHQSVISGYERPQYFQDTMLQGAFRYFVHDHFFTIDGSETLMRDELRFEAPWGLLGRIAERIAVRSHMENFLRERNSSLRATAEGNAAVWGRFLPEQAQHHINHVHRP